MPIKSKAQLGKLGELVKEGKMSQAKFQEFLDATPDVSALPERVGKHKPLSTLVKMGRKATVIK